MNPSKKQKASDKPKQRLVTAFGVVIAVLIYLPLRSGFLGAGSQEFAELWLSISLVLMGVRAIVTELGIRR